MPLPQHPPGSGGKRARVHYCYVSTQPGQNWHAWIAGPCHWFLSHTKGRSQPCVEEMTDGEIHCERCAAGHQCEVIGYQPLYREVDCKPVMVIVHEYGREAVDALKLHQRVTVGRGAEQSDGVYVTPALKSDPRYTSTLPERMRAADLTETLLRVWRIPELAEWYRQTHGTPEPVSEKPVKVPEKAPDGIISPKLRETAKKLLSDPQKAALADDIDAVKERLRIKAANLKPSTNGQH